MATQYKLCSLFVLFEESSGSGLSTKLGTSVRLSILLSTVMPFLCTTFQFGAMPPQCFSLQEKNCVNLNIHQMPNYPNNVFH